jgi:alkylation response protein AidB-like acyl-CoA dehydrogenase
MLEIRDELRAVARRFVSEHYPSARVRALMETPEGNDPALWSMFAEMGWLGLEIPEEHGGAGMSFAELAVVIEELGRAVAPSPFLATVVLGAGAVIASGSQEQRSTILPRIASGDLLTTVALTGPSGRCDLDSIDGRASSVADGYRLDGHWGFVPDAHASSMLVVAALADPGVSLFLVDADASGVEITPTPTVDRTRRLCRIDLDGVTVGPDALLGARGGAAAVIGWLLDRAAVALAADALGGAQRALEMTVEYAKERVQFGRPIGSFQAVKHHCADMLVAVETSRVAAETAARDQPSAPGEPSRWAAIAKSHCTDAYARVAGDGVQVHGGIGFTWEHDMHLYLKRAKLDQALFGEPSWHRERLARIVLSET